MMHKKYLTLLEKTKNLWSEKSNLSSKGFTNATPAVWAYQIILINYILMQKNQL